MFRIIAAVQFETRKAIKTLEFANSKYIGDPINIIRILNQKGCQEILVNDIGATQHGNLDLEYIKLLAEEARIPFSYGGGLSQLTNSKSLTQLGVERFVVSTAIHEEPDYVSTLVKTLGSSSIAACLELAYVEKEWTIKYRGGRLQSTLSFNETISRALEIGVGEIILKPVNFDGVSGINLIEGYKDILDNVKIHNLQNQVELLVSGGFHNEALLNLGIKELKIDGIIIGTLVCFLRGNRDSILINYPKQWSIKA
jgi:cyclase